MIMASQVKDTKIWVGLIILAITSTVGAMTYFTPLNVFAAFVDKYEYDNSQAKQISLRGQVMQCASTLKEYGHWTDTEAKLCDDAEVQLKAVTESVNARWGKGN